MLTGKSTDDPRRDNIEDRHPKEDDFFDRISSFSEDNSETSGLTEVEESGRNYCQVQLSKDATKAYITVHAPRNEAISIDLVLRALAREKVKLGIRKETLEHLISDRGIRDKPVLIATGKSAQPGDDAEIKYFFDAEPKPRVHINESGAVDYRETGIIQSVKQGQVLAVKTPPTAGVDGITVTGVTIPSKPGKDILLKSGENTNFTDSTQLRLVASKNGSVRGLPNGEVEVTETFEVNGDVDMKCGNIYFEGHVLIKGDVRAGFRVVATKDIEIKGVVEDAEIQSGGNVMIRRGMVGSGRGIIQAMGDVYVKFVENQKIRCNGDVHVAEAVLFGDIACGGSVTVRHGRGVIIGGRICAGKGIDVRILGNIHYTPTTVWASYQPQIDDLLERFQKALAKESNTREKIQEAINKLVQQKMSGDSYRVSGEKQLEELYRNVQNINKWTTTIKKVYSDMFDHRVLSFKDGLIRVSRKAFPGVTMRIGDAKKKLDEELSTGIYIYINGKIEKSGKLRAI